MIEAEKIINTGVWKTYIPEKKPEHLTNLSVIFCKSSLKDYDDFYDFIKGDDPTGDAFLLVDKNKTVVCSVMDDGTDSFGIPNRQQIWPAGFRLLIAKGVPAQDYRGMVWDGKNTLNDPPPVIVPISATQAKIALHRAELLEKAESIVATNAELKIWYDTSQFWERENTYVKSLFKKLGLNKTEIDNFFLDATKIG